MILRSTFEIINEKYGDLNPDEYIYFQYNYFAEKSKIEHMFDIIRKNPLSLYFIDKKSTTIKELKTLIARHRNTPEFILDLLRKDEDYSIRFLANRKDPLGILKGSADVSEEDFETFMHSNDYRVLKRIINHKKSNINTLYKFFCIYSENGKQNPKTNSNFRSINELARTKIKNLINNATLSLDDYNKFLFSDDKLINRFIEEYNCFELVLKANKTPETILDKLYSTLVSPKRIISGEEYKTYHLLSFIFCNTNLSKEIKACIYEFIKRTGKNTKNEFQYHIDYIAEKSSSIDVLNYIVDFISLDGYSKARDESIIKAILRNRNTTDEILINIFDKIKDIDEDLKTLILAMFARQGKITASFVITRLDSFKREWFITNNRISKEERQAILDLYKNYGDLL